MIDGNLAHQILRVGPSAPRAARGRDRGRRGRRRSDTLQGDLVRARRLAARASRAVSGRRCATGSASCSPISSTSSSRSTPSRWSSSAARAASRARCSARSFVTFTVKFIELIQGVEAVKALQRRQPVARSQRAPHGHLRGRAHRAHDPSSRGSARRTRALSQPRCAPEPKGPRPSAERSGGDANEARARIRGRGMSVLELSRRHEDVRRHQGRHAA